MVCGRPFVGPLLKNDFFAAGSTFFKRKQPEKRAGNMKTHLNPPKSDRFINSANSGSLWKFGQGSKKTLDFDQNRTQLTQKCPFPPKID